MSPGTTVSAAVGMRDLVREKDWSTTPLGPAHRWPQSLKT